MNDDERTRVIKRTPAAKPEGSDDATSVLERTQTNRDSAREPQTRILAGVDQPSSGTDNAADVYELTVSWLVVIAGPGRGASREISFDMDSVGRNPD
ncbi:hypothetical protein [Breoghania sp.]|uniref:hypothetical protein n=1 Tax=Breoghania sp. TaxID=2065378 RepID=UPI00263148D0|nr:hypothetical protein [Breoghania sp.]MDJ0930642.1 hypothetical protein [Breoghania sp.]